MSERDTEKAAGGAGNIKSKRRIVLASVVAVIILVSISVYVLNGKGNENLSAPVYSVERVMGNPSSFTGNISVSGTVISADSSKSLFTLGCSDACVIMPVVYYGKLPAVGSEITVYGEIKSDAGKYFFNASEVS